MLFHLRGEAQYVFFRRFFSADCDSRRGASDERGGAAAQASGDWNLVLHGKMYWGQTQAVAFRGVVHGTQDQIFFRGAWQSRAAVNSAGARLAARGWARLHGGSHREK